MRIAPYSRDLSWGSCWFRGKLHDAARCHEQEVLRDRQSRTDLWFSQIHNNVSSI